MPNDGLQDLMLNEHENNKNLNFKRLLMVIAGFVILFLIVIAIVGLFSSQDEEQTAQVQQPRLVLPPVPAAKEEQPSAIEPALVNEPKDEQKDGDGMFEQVPIVAESKSDDDFESMIKRLKDQEKAAAKPAKESVDTPSITNQPKPVGTKKSEATVAKKPEPKKSEVKPASQPKPANKPATPPAKKQESVNLKELVKSTSAPSVSQNVPSGAYVQVAAVSKFSPSASYVSKLKEKGYAVHLLKVGAATKVLVGPFSTDKLKQAVSEIREQIAKEAFVYRVK
ncbi:SPOR domain-containing protein [Campylobacter sp. 19-13652]|uniref:SPOR domain-containing protein n=1 Tax=Campylobacter sp. 19-13652 TaxID=2840180 RepID=UPI001C761240|nr:SPOR domain-containing protein [Campylobacter sp. 19-13652]BCX79766.1 membrane protein [Campylobacter sp. 19-13652]